MVSVYLIGKRLYSPTAGLLSAFVLATMPFYVFMTKKYLMETCLLGIVAFAFYALLRTEFFKNIKWSVILGVTMGVGMLMKWSFAIYFFVPLFMVISSSYKRWKNILVSFIVSIPIFSLWYILHARRFISMYSFIAFNTQVEPFWTRTFNLHNLMLIAARMPRHISLFYTFLLVCGILLSTYLLIHSFHSRQSGKRKRIGDEKQFYHLVMLATLAFIYVVFTIVRIKTDRYTLPVYFICAILAGYAIYILLERKEWPRIVAYALCIMIILTGLTQYINESYDVKKVDGWPWRNLYQKEINYPIVYQTLDYLQINKTSQIIILSISRFSEELLGGIQIHLLLRGYNISLQHPYIHFTDGTFYNEEKLNTDITHYFKIADFVLVNSNEECIVSFMNITDCNYYIHRLHNHFAKIQDDYQLLNVINTKHYLDRDLHIYINKKTTNELNVT